MAPADRGTGVHQDSVTSPMPALESLLYYHRQDGRRKYLKDAIEASTCQQEGSSSDMPAAETRLT